MPPALAFHGGGSGVRMANGSRRTTPTSAGAEARRSRKKRGKPSSTSQGKDRFWLKAIEREIQKREAYKSICIDSWRGLGSVTDEKLEQAWNRYQLVLALSDARYERERFLALNRHLTGLVKALAVSDRSESPAPNKSFAHLESEPNNKASAERRAAISALESVCDFLRSTRRLHSRVLEGLRILLKNIEHGEATPEIFKPSLSAGRKTDGSYLQSLKGYFAGMAFVQMESGMSREQATLWVARNIPPDLSRQISSKPIRNSTVKEWMSQYGTTSKIRRELKSINTLDTAERLVSFIRS
jgi:hypothetical protein